MVTLRSLRGGFSLLELLVVTAMISMICAMGLLRLGNCLATAELSAAALELAADLRWMQQASVNSPVGAGGPFYSITFNQASSGGYVVKAGLNVHKRVVFPESVRLANLPQAISFTMVGSPTRAQSIALKSLRTNEVRYVIVAAVTGRVRLSDSAAWEGGE